MNTISIIIEYIHIDYNLLLQSYFEQLWLLKEMYVKKVGGGVMGHLVKVRAMGVM